MKRNVLWTQDAVEALNDVSARDLRTAKRLVVALRSFGAGERADVKKLAGRPETWRIRVGDWRVFVSIQGPEPVVEGFLARKDAY
jgi:mRNA-degrading endonuclease RelE of RelBE toxin-antitoxin system